MNSASSIAPGALLALLILLAIGVTTVRSVRRRRRDRMRDRMMRLDGARHRGDPFDDDDDDKLDTGARPRDGRWIALAAIIGVAVIFYAAVSQRGVRVVTNVQYSSASSSSPEPMERRAEHVTERYLDAVGRDSDTAEVLAARARAAADQQKNEAVRLADFAERREAELDPELGRVMGVSGVPPVPGMPPVRFSGDPFASGRGWWASLDMIHAVGAVALLLAWAIWSRRTA